MNNSIKDSNGFWPSVTALPILLAFATWQFYRFVTFTGVDGIVDLQGGKLHLWTAVAATLLAAIVGFFLISLIRGQAEKNTLHIT